MTHTLTYSSEVAPLRSCQVTLIKQLTLTAADGFHRWASVSRFQPVVNIQT